MRTRLSALLTVLATGITLAAQSPAGNQQPTFRTGANYVRVDLYATLDGQPVTDLQPGEVQVAEDDVPQAIESFEHVLVRSAGPQEARSEPIGIDASRQAAAGARARVFVIFLDTYHTGVEGTAKMRLPLVRFLDRVLGPDDLVALMTPEMSATNISFGRKTTIISNVMQEEWWGRRNRLVDNDPKEDLYEACGAALGLSREMVAEMKARRREKLTLDALADLVVHLGGVREERKAVVAVTEGWVLHRPDMKLADAVGERGPARPPLFRPPVPPPAEAGTLSQPMEIECEADRRALALVDHDLRIRELTEDANRGNVTFYPVYARGLAVFDADIGPDAPPPGEVDARNLRARQESLRFVADNTDGTSVINTNNIDAALKRITDDLSSYYLLGYYSTNTQLDGRFREITVRVTRPGVRVRARRGYRGRTAEDVLSGAGSKETAEAAAMTTALNAVASVNTRSPFRIRSSSWARSAPDGNTLGNFWIVGELDFRTRRELAWTAGSQAEIAVMAADGRQVESRTVSVRASDGAFGIRVPEAGALPAGEYAVRVRLQPDGDPGLALTDLARVVVRATSTPFGEAVLWRRGPSTGPRHVRTADPRFQRSDRIRLELPAPVTAAEPATARMLDRAGNPLSIPLQVTRREEPSADMAWIVVDANLAPLAAGDYAIEVSQDASKQVTAFRVVP